MCASALEVVDLNGDVTLRELPRGVATTPSCILGEALMWASAIDVVERNCAVAPPREPGRAPLYDASVGFGIARMCAHAVGDAERNDADGSTFARFGEREPPLRGDAYVELMRLRMWLSRSDGDLERNAAVPCAPIVERWPWYGPGVTRSEQSLMWASADDVVERNMCEPVSVARRRCAEPMPATKSVEPPEGLIACDCEGLWPEKRERGVDVTPRGVVEPRAGVAASEPSP
mmetsp:Transcript_28229/g.87495  ORF Transcript_28229/g.87495 Transcript_28229/m.87495 type:complete len:232 (-) Transcript_28229:86-781(-)